MGTVVLDRRQPRRHDDYPARRETSQERSGIPDHGHVGLGARQPATGLVTLRASFPSADAKDARHFDYAAPDGATQAATTSLPDDALKDLGDSWTWTQTILVDGVEPSGCTASPPI